jgi:hypothetical protein
MDLVINMQCENWSRDMNKKWDNWHAHWLCQVNDLYNKIPAQYKTDWQFQVRYCKQLKYWWTPFYWPSRKNKKTGKPCYIEAQKSFTIIK